VLRFYGDDRFGREAMSGGCCLVAGYMADSTTWAGLVRDWKAVLGLDPKIEYFRTRDCYDLCGPFANFKRRAADKKLDALIAVIEKWGDALYWADSTMTWDTFNRSVVKANPDAALRAFDSPYFFCAFGAMCAAVESIAALGVQVPVTPKSAWKVWFLKRLVSLGRKGQN
jgi:hypothetical protein